MESMLKSKLKRESIEKEAKKAVKIYKDDKGKKHIEWQENDKEIQKNEPNGKCKFEND